MPATNNASLRLPVLGVLFTFTGCTALLAEQAFEKLLSTLVGASTPAAATVLAVYFAGLTLGGFLYSRLVRLAQASRVRLPHPLRSYGALEACVGVWALVLYLAFDELIAFFAPLLATGADHFWWLQCLRLFVAACWILPATVPMGASFPAIVDALEQLGVPGRGKAMVGFYSLNLLGAILGAVAGPFLVFPYWGVTGALLFASAVNLTVAMVAIGIARGLPGRVVEERSQETPGPVASSGQLRVILAIAFFSGFLFFALEVVWTHLIGAVLGNSIYAFAAMLAVVLLGLGLGGWQIASRYPAEQKVPVNALAQLLLSAALMLALLNWLWPDIPHVLAVLGANIESFGMGEMLRWSVAVAMLVLPAKQLGMVYPTLFRLETFPLHASASAAGRAVAANSIGCILGALLTGFLLIPRLGSERTLLVVTAGCAVWGFAIGVSHRAREGRFRLWVLAAVVLAALLFQRPWNRLNLTSGLHVYFRFADVFAGSKLMFFHEDTLGGITTVVENPAGVGGQPRPYLTLLTNGKFQGNDSWEMDAQTGIALVPMLFTSQFDDALVVGLGTGRSAHVVDAMGFAAIDVAEIAPGIVQAAREYFGHVNGGVLDKPHVRLLLEDGRNLLLLREKQYDLITMEISSVWFAGATNLYSEEFYRLARARLKPSGIFQQWIQIHHIGTDELQTAIATVHRVFPHVSFWVVGGQGILVGSLTPQTILPAGLAALQQHGESIGWPTDELPARLSELVASRLLAPEDVDALVRQRGIVVNSDRNRRLEYFTPRYNYSMVNYRNLNTAALAAFATFPAPRISPDATGPLAEICRQVTSADYRRRFGL